MLINGDDVSFDSSPFFEHTHQATVRDVLGYVVIGQISEAETVPRGGQQEDLGSLDKAYRAAPSSDQLSTLSPTPAEQGRAAGANELAPIAPPTSADRAQRYAATLTLRLPTANGVSKATSRALHVVASLGGYPQTVRVDAAREDIRQWYSDRFLQLRETAFRDPHSYFAKYAHLTDEEALDESHRIWDTINGPNLEKNILPTLGRATLVLRKAADHSIRWVRLRKL